jgi:hypothetical protein
VRQTVRGNTLGEQKANVKRKKSGMLFSCRDCKCLTPAGMSQAESEQLLNLLAASMIQRW